MTHGSLKVEASCQRPQPRMRPATAIGAAARFYSSSSPHAADDNVSVASADDDEPVLERLTGMIGSWAESGPEFQATGTRLHSADSEPLLRETLSLVMP